MSYTCPVCQRTSHNPNDERERYCGQCHVFEDDALLLLELLKRREARETQEKSPPGESA